MAAAASSARPKQQWKPSRGKEHNGDVTDRSGTRAPFQSKYTGFETVALPSSSSSSLPSSSQAIDPFPSASSSGISAALSTQTSFIPYLPQDDAVAAGLGAENGGIDAMETQRVADLLNEELSSLLRMQPEEFWKTVAMDTSIEVSLDSYLQFRRRWYDLHTNKGNTVLAGVIVGDQLLLRRVFMVLYRMSLKSEYRSQQTNINSVSASPADSTFQRRFFDISKLLDICAIYGKDNQDLTNQLVRNAFSIDDGLFDDLASAVPVISETVQIMLQRCVYASKMQLPAKPPEMSSVVGRIRQELVEVLDFLSDTVISLSSFVDVYSEAAVVLACAGKQSDPGNQILLTLELMHDSLIPVVRKSFFHLQGPSREVAMESSIEIRLKRLRFQLIDLVWKLFSFSHLKESTYPESQERYVNDLLEMYVCDPKTRGVELVQALSGMVEESSSPFTDGITCSGALIRNVNRKYNLLEMVSELCKKGFILLDSAQYEYVVAILSQQSEISSGPMSNYPDLTHEVSDIDVVNESKISHIRDILPSYGVGFIAACLEAYDDNTEEVIQRILEGTLHPSLQSLDVSLEARPDIRNASLPAKEKGKGKIDEAPSQKATNFSNKPNGIQNARLERDLDDSTHRLSSSMSASSSAVRNDSGNDNPEGFDFHFAKDLKGRFIRKDKGEESMRAVPNERIADDALRKAAYASQYEDEYDDSFDDLGTSIADGVEEAESLVDLVRPKALVGTERDFHQDSRISSGGRTAGVSRGDWPANNGLSQEARSTAQQNKISVNDSQRKGQQPAGRNRGRGRRNEPRGQFYVKDGMNYSYKVGGSVAVASAEAAEMLKRTERETIYGLGQGGNVPLSENQTAQAPQRNSNSNPNREDSSSHGARGRGRGPPRRDHDHYNRKDRSMQKHFASLGGI